MAGLRVQAMLNLVSLEAFILVRPPPVEKSLVPDIMIEYTLMIARRTGRLYTNGASGMRSREADLCEALR